MPECISTSVGGDRNRLRKGHCIRPGALACYAMLRRGALTVTDGDDRAVSRSVVAMGIAPHKEGFAVASSPQLPLADDLFLTAHDTVKGKSLLTPATLGLGLAAALIGELVFWRRLDLIDGKLALIDDRPTGDPATTAVLDQLLREGHHRAVRDWISFLATGIATDLVERRLSRAGLLHRQEKRGLLGTKVSFVPADSMVAGWPATRIRTFISRG